MICPEGGLRPSIEMKGEHPTMMKNLIAVFTLIGMNAAMNDRVL